MEANASRRRRRRAVTAALVEHIASLEREIADTEAFIREHIDSHPTLRAQSALLLSIPGIGDTTAAKFLAEILDVHLYVFLRQNGLLC